MNIPVLMQRLLPVAVIAVAMLAAGALFATRPKPATEAVQDAGKLVEVHSARRAPQRLAIVAKGTVVPAREVVIQPQVSGRVETLASALVPGGLVSAGGLLFSIERSDYQLAVEQAGTRVAEAEAALALERGRQAVAEREWALFEDELPTQRDGALALREPQLKAAEAALVAARSQLEQARLNLERTDVRAPFNAVVTTENMEIGQIVSPQTQAARLVGTDRFWVQASVPVADLGLIDIATQDRPGAPAVVRYDTGNDVIVHSAEVVRRLAGLERTGQMARLIVAVDDPLGLDDASKQSLLLESFVEVEFDTGRDVDVVRLQPQWLRNGNKVHVYADGKLVIREVDVVMRQPDAVLVGAGLSDGDLVVTTTLSAPVAGMKLRIGEDANIAAAGAAR